MLKKTNKNYIEIQDYSRHLLKEIEVLKSTLDELHQEINLIELQHNNQMCKTLIQKNKPIKLLTNA